MSAGWEQTDDGQMLSRRSMESWTRARCSTPDSPEGKIPGLQRGLPGIGWRDRGCADLDVPQTEKRLLGRPPTSVQPCRRPGKRDQKPAFSLSDSPSFYFTISLRTVPPSLRSLLPPARHLRGLCSASIHSWPWSSGAVVLLRGYLRHILYFSHHLMVLHSYPFPFS